MPYPGVITHTPEPVELLEQAPPYPEMVGAGGLGGSRAPLSWPEGPARCLALLGLPRRQPARHHAAWRHFTSGLTEITQHFY